MAAEAFEALSTRLCPWLAEPLRTFEAAHAAQRLGHAWLLTGRAGLGKLNLALVMADRLLHGRVGAALPPELSAAQAHEAMSDVHGPANHHPDLHWVFPAEDKRTIAVDQVREVTEQLGLKALRGSAKVVVVEPAEAMTVSAANALLKSLEEPAAGTYMLLLSRQPGRLPSTIRSRCQTLVVRGPRGDDARAALPPLLQAERSSETYYSIINNLEDRLKGLLEGRTDPRSVVEEWLKLDLKTVLDWLIARIQLTLRARITGHGSTAVTESGAPPLHNPEAESTLGTLFEQLAAAERIRDQLGSGLNTELALHVLLLGFTPERGRS